MICDGHAVIYSQCMDAGREDFRALCDEAVATFGRNESSWLVTGMMDENDWSMKLCREDQMATIATPDGMGSIDGIGNLFESKPKLIKTKTRTFYREPLV